MKITRVFADEHGESHFEDVKIALADAGAIGRLSERVPASAVIFRTNEPNYDYDWHPAPERQLIVLLDGSIEIEVSSGERRTFAGGDVLLVEDTEGRGHRTRNVEARERRSIFVLLGPRRESGGPL